MVFVEPFSWVELHAAPQTGTFAQGHAWAPVASQLCHKTPLSPATEPWPPLLYKRQRSCGHPRADGSLQSMPSDTAAVSGVPAFSRMGPEGVECALGPAYQQWDTHGGLCLLLLLQDVAGCVLSLLFQFPFREATSHSTASAMRPLLD